MTLPDLATLYRVTDISWPAAAQHRAGPWTIRDGRGGGQRVSAATADGDWQPADIALAEGAMRALGQTPLFMVRAGEDRLDAALAAQGYRIKDPVVLYAAPAAQIATRRPPPVTAFTVWPPLATQAEIWAQGGIGPGRLAVMERAPDPKTTLLGRADDRPAGTVYVGSGLGCAMIHALEVAAAHRRKGLARHLTVAAAFWALDQGLDWLTLVTTRANAASNALYTSLGMTPVGEYHYRISPEGQP